MVADLVLMGEWHPVAFSEEIQDAPIGRILLGERLVLFRNSASIHAWKDLCVHRGAALSLGKVVDDTLVCPYHGWRYDGSGACVRIPQQKPEQSITRQACAVTYESLEKHGLVWVRLRPSSSSEIPYYKEFEDDKFRTVFCGPYALNASAPRVIENFLDVGHLAFLHEGYLGDSAFPEIPDYNVTVTDDGIRSDEIDLFQPDPDSTGNSGIARYVYEVLKPTTARLMKTNPLTGDVFSILFSVMPVEERLSKVYVALSRNYAFDAPDDQFTSFQTFILEQDTLILESQRPELLPLDLQSELHLKPDRLSIAYRNWLKTSRVTWGTA
ncbi:Rieske 2Fe-2S domain-containing protein [Cohnella sp.]|uniref:aromatic ring-hydroxylating dioxygenase subunit alpha n=1 Tax=Cohnella sp. TaxID=1883426 RepID=UPI003563BA7F